MKDPIHDLHFIPFKLAMAIYKQGYNEESLFAYRYNTDDLSNVELICLGSPKKSITLKNYSTIPALTYEEAAEWIKNTYHCFIVLIPGGFIPSLPQDMSLPEKFEDLELQLNWLAEIYQIKERPNNSSNVSLDNNSPLHLCYVAPNNASYYLAYNKCIEIILDNY